MNDFRVFDTSFLLFPLVSFLSIFQISIRHVISSTVAKIVSHLCRHNEIFLFADRFRLHRKAFHERALLPVVMARGTSRKTLC